MSHFFLVLLSLFFGVIQTTSASTKSLNPNLKYNTYPNRVAEKSAIVEWGHSAILSALDAAVADFGVPTSQSAYFEVETTPILARPVDGVGSTKETEFVDDGDYGVPYPGPLDNKDDVYGNMLVMTNHAGLSGVTMARIAKESGAVALMVVNVDDENRDSIFSLEPENDQEREYAEEHIDIPIIMISLSSGHLITTATVEEGMKEEDIVNDGMPDRIRLYATEDRQFFEDVSNQNPVLYIIHNLLSEVECNMLVEQAKGKFELLDDSVSNLLENVVAEQTTKAINIERAILWKGQLNNHVGMQIDERIEQVTGYPKDQYSDWQITKHVKGSRHELHYDQHPIYPPVATITVFLNDFQEDDENVGGEIVFPNVKDGSPVMITPQLGMAVVHHNTDYEGNVDYSAVYGEMNLRLDGKVKYIARKFVYAEPLPPSKRLLLPLFAYPFGGKLPRWIVGVHDLLLVKFGVEKGTTYFDKLCAMYPVLVLLIIGTIIQRFIQDQLSSSQKSNEKGSKLKKGNDGKKKSKKDKKDN